MLGSNRQGKTGLEKIQPRPLMPLPTGAGVDTSRLVTAGRAAKATGGGLTGWVQDALGRLGFLDKESELLSSELEKGLRRLARTQADALLVQSLVGLGAALGSALGGSALGTGGDTGGAGAQSAFAAMVRPALGAQAARLEALSSRLQGLDEERARLNSRLVEAAFGAALDEERAQRDFERKLVMDQLDFGQRKELQSREERTRYWFDIFSRAIELGAPPPDPDLVDEIVSGGQLSPEGKKKLYSWIDGLRQAQQFELARKAFELYATEQRLKLDWYGAQTRRQELEQQRQQKQTTARQKVYWVSSLLPVIKNLPAEALADGSLVREYKDKGINVYALHQLAQYEDRLARGKLGTEDVRSMADLYYDFWQELLTDPDRPDAEELKYVQGRLERLFPRITNFLKKQR